MKYLFVATAGFREIEKWVEGEGEKEARQKFWASLTIEQQEAVEWIECVDEK